MENDATAGVQHGLEQLIVKRYVAQAACFFGRRPWNIDGVSFYPKYCCLFSSR
jgi:hypothetical protein